MLNDTVLMHWLDALDLVCQEYCRANKMISNKKKGGGI